MDTYDYDKNVNINNIIRPKDIDSNETQQENNPNANLYRFLFKQINFYIFPKYLKTNFSLPQQYFKGGLFPVCMYILTFNPPQMHHVELRFS